MTRRRLLFGLLLSALLACSVGVLWLANARKVTRATFERVKDGMMREEVIRIVGGPSDGELTGKIMMETASPDEGYFDVWACDEALLLVRFNDNGKAVEVGVRQNTEGPPTLTERIRRWLGL